MIWLIIIVLILVLLAIFIPETKYKYINADAGCFDSITYKITEYNNFETAKKETHFKTAIYKVPDYLLDKMQQIKNPREAESFLLNNECEIVYIERGKIF